MVPGPAIVGQEAAHVAEGVGLHVNKRRVVEPAVDSVFRVSRSLALQTGGVRTLPAAIGSGGVLPRADRYRHAALQAHDAVQTPVAGNESGGALRQVFAVLAERQLIL